MRELLKERVGKRKRYIATYSKHSRRFHKKINILLHNVTDTETNEVVAEHLWISNTSEVYVVGYLNEGDILEFDADSVLYLKGYVGKRVKHERDSSDSISIDYHLINLDNITRTTPLPTDHYDNNDSESEVIING